jgi:peptidoglycan/xylan/chitin deacetylase (PgdA/CDA1 family)
VLARTISRTLALTLAALRREGVDPAVVRAGSRTLSEVRNEVLAATPAEVMAFVDDDVAVRPGWWEALLEAWDQAPDDRGCIGGPIGATFVGPRPTWLTDDLLGVLGVAAGGGTFHGGNVSFRTEALRGVGGFWPMRGRPELHDWFSEEHHAQHQLAAAGWSAAAVPAMAADRLVDVHRLRRRDVLERRVRYGARSALIGDRRPRPFAARTMARSAVGAAVSAARLDPVHATERLARAMENAGVLVAPLVARRDLEPVATETPFLHSVPKPRSGRAWRMGWPARPLILVYHRVDEGGSASIAPQNFAAHMDVLADRRRPVTLEAIAAGEAPPDGVAVTFDDGYRATMRHALPALEASDLLATVFVCTGHVADGRPFWWDVAARLLRQGGPAPVRLVVDGETRAWARADRAERHVIAWLQSKSPEAIDAALAELERSLGPDRDPLADEQPLSVEDLQSLAASPLVTIGAHTRSHINLRVASAQRRREELEASRGDLAGWLGGEPPEGLAYPFGIPGSDVDPDTMRAARDAGFEYAVVTAPDTDGRSDRFALPRVAPPNVGADGFAAFLGALKAAS